MKTATIQSKETTVNKPMGRFKTLKEFADYKTDIANKMLAKIDRKQLD